MARDPAFNNLEAKTDAELRVLMKKAGMQNQPIIPTTRKLILTRLKKFAATGSIDASPQQSPATSRKASATSTSKKATAVFSSDEDDEDDDDREEATISSSQIKQKFPSGTRNVLNSRKLAAKAAKQQTDSESDIAASSSSSRPISGRRNGSSSPRRKVTVGSSATQSSASSAVSPPPPSSTPAPTLPPPVARSQPAPASSSSSTATTNVNRLVSPTAAATSAFSSDEGEPDVDMADVQANKTTSTTRSEIPAAVSSQPASVGFNRPLTPPRAPSTTPLSIPPTPQRPIAPATTSGRSSVFGDTVDHAIKSVRQRIGLSDLPSSSPTANVGRRIPAASPPPIDKYKRTIAQSPPPNRPNRHDPEVSLINQDETEQTTDEEEETVNYAKPPRYVVLHETPFLQRFANFLDRYVPLSGLLFTFAILLILAFGFFAVDFTTLLNSGGNLTSEMKALSMWGPSSSSQQRASADLPPPLPKVVPLYAEDIIPMCDAADSLAEDDQHGYALAKTSTFCLPTIAEAANATHTARIMVDELRRHRGDRECELAPHHEYYVEKHRLADIIRRKMHAENRHDSDENFVPFHDALQLAQLNPHWGVTCTDSTGSTPSDFSKCHRVKSHESAHTFGCMAYLILRHVFYYIVGALGAIVGVSMLYYFLREYRRMNQAEQKQKMQMVEQIITLVRNHRHNGYNDGIPVNHVRDILVPHRQRTRAALKAFSEAYRYVLTNDSRVVLKELMHTAVGGEPQQVLLWSGSAGPTETTAGSVSVSGSGRKQQQRDAVDYAGDDRFETENDEDVQVVNQLDLSGTGSPAGTSGYGTGNTSSLYDKRENIQRRSAAHTGRYWQGNAFAPERQARPDFPSDCLKIRGMFDGTQEDQASGMDVWVQEVKDAIVDKCGPETRITHMHVDPKSADGIVLMMCASRADAGRAYQVLHGNWFDSKLVSVKYLHTQQYLERFPAAAWTKEPIQASKKNAGKSLRMLSDVQNAQNVAPL